MTAHGILATNPLRASDDVLSGATGQPGESIDTFVRAVARASQPEHAPPRPAPHSTMPACGPARDGNAAGSQTPGRQHRHPGHPSAGEQPDPEAPRGTAAFPRVLVADNEALTGDAVAGALAVRGQFEVSDRRPTTGADTLDAVETEAPDVVVIADQLVDTDGPALTREILYRAPGTKVIQLSLAYGRIQVDEALQSGAVGVLPKGGIDVDTLVEGVHEAMAGAVPIFAERTRRAIEQIEQRGGYLADKAERLAQLTPRQLEVLHLLDEGLDIRRVARRLGVAEATVQRHVHNMLRSLDVQTQVEAVAVARDLDYL